MPNNKERKMITEQQKDGIRLMEMRESNGFIVVDNFEVALV